jgi:hypothetical protein
MKLCVLNLFNNENGIGHGYEESLIAVPAWKLLVPFLSSERKISCTPAGA